MEGNDVKAGLRVKTIRLGDDTGMIIPPRYILVRREGVFGTIINFVPGHGGDVWFVQHENSEEVGAYVFTEIEPAPGKLSDVIAELEQYAARRQHQSEHGSPVSSLSEDTGAGMVAEAIQGIIVKLKQVSSI